MVFQLPGHEQFEVVGFERKRRNLMFETAEKSGNDD